MATNNSSDIITGATGALLIGQGVGTAPIWTTSTYPTTNAINTLLYASSANTMAALATANSSVLITSGGGVPSFSTTLPSGLSATNLTLTTPALGTPSSGTLTNCTGLPVAGGGTGNSTFTAYSVICAGTTATGAFQNVSGVGTSGQVLTSQGAGALPHWSSVSASTGRLLAVTAFTTSGTWTANGSTTSVIVKVIGGGGGGAGASASTIGGSGGGGGGYAELYTSSQGASQTVTIGAGGTAGTNAPTNGGSGGTSSFGALCSASGGTGAAVSSASAFGQAGSGGVGSSGTFNSQGSGGGVSSYVSATGVAGGTGGSSVLGGGGVGVPSSPGGTGCNYGGGGAGGAELSNVNGGAGAGGIIIVYEYS